MASYIPTAGATDLAARVVDDQDQIEELFADPSEVDDPELHVLLLDGDEGLLVLGSPEELRAFARRVSEAVEAL